MAQAIAVAGGRRVGVCRALAVVAGVVLAVRLWVAIPVFSPTTDEPCHIGAALSMVEARRLVALVSHPPLARWVMAVPLWAEGARLPQCRGMHTVQKEDVGYALGTQVLYGSTASFRTLLNNTRRVMLVFPLLALWFLYRLAAHLAGEAVACASVVFFSVDPTLLGHGFWICTDAAACAGFLAALFYGVRWLDRPTLPAAVAAGVAVGAAVALKFSCLFVLPSLALLLLLRWREGLRFRWQRRLGEIAAGCGVALLTLWATYWFNVGPLGDQNVFGHPPAWERLPHWFLWTPVPMPAFFLGLGRLIAHDVVGQAAYLNGQVRGRGWWYYFPELLVVKEPIGFLVAFALAVVIASVGRQWRRWPALVCLVPAAVFLLLSMKGHIDLGIRHILPLIPLLYLFACWQLMRARWVAVLGACVVVAGIETAVVHPDYLAFFNVAAGGVAHGDRLALDSNLDWNQDLYRLADQIHRNPPPHGYALRLTGERNGPLLRQLGLDPAALRRPAHDTRLYISKDERLLSGILPWLAGYRPVGHVGVSIDVYDLPPARVGEADDHPNPDMPQRE